MSIYLLHLLLLIIIANAAPIVLRVIMDGRYDKAIDFGFKLPDNKPVFGRSKTWRGFFGAVVFTSIAAAMLGYSPLTGAEVAVYSVLGDILSSFIKRRLALAPSSMAPLLDQIPESLVPAVMLRQRFELDIQSILVLVSLFVMLEMLLSYIFFKLGVRRRPY